MSDTGTAPPLASSLLPPALAAPAERLIGELKGNPRALAGLAIIGLILLFSGVLRLDDEITHRHQAIAEARDRLARYQAVAGDEGWEDRRAIASARAAELDARLWVAETEGLAVALVQDWLSQIIRESGLDGQGVNLEADRSVSGLPQGVGMIGATLRGRMEPQAMTDFLERVARADRMVSIEQLRVRTTPIARYDMVLRAWWRTPPPAPAAAAGQGGT